MHNFDQHSLVWQPTRIQEESSCETQLLSTIQEIASSTAKGHHVDTILLDFAKAFDKGPHQDYFTSWTTMEWEEMSNHG